MPNIPITDTTTFTQIQKAFEGAKDTKHLRADETGTRLYTHSSWKKSGLGQAAAQRRAEKHQRGVDFIKAAIDRQVGREGVGERVFQNLLTAGRLRDSAKVSVAELATIGREIPEAASQMLKEENRELAGQLRGRFDDIQARSLMLLNLKDDAPPDTIVKEGSDPMRSNPNDAETHEALVAIREGRLGELDLTQTVAALLAVGRKTAAVENVHTLAGLIRHPSVAQAVGYLSSRYMLGRDQEALGSEEAQHVMQQGANALRQTIDQELTPQEKAAFKKRVDFMADYAWLCHRKLGVCSKEISADEDIKFWAKALSVNSSVHLGHELLGMIAAIGGKSRDAQIAARDFITALVVHRDIIFPDE